MSITTDKFRPGSSFGRALFISGLIATAILLIPQVPGMAADAPTTTVGGGTPLQHPQEIAVHVQLKGWGFENRAGLRADLTGSAASVGRVEVGLAGDATAAAVIGIQDGKLRIRSKARYTFTAPDGTFFGDSASVLSVPVVLTPTGPVPDQDRFIDLEFTIGVLGGTGRYRNAAGTLTLRGVLAEIPPENGRRRFAVELSGDGTLIVERDAERV